jgi:hypothetical protein
MYTSFLVQPKFLPESSLLSHEIITRWGQADYDDVTKREEHLDTLKLEWDAKDYARNRASAYPLLGDQLDMMYKDTKNSTTTHADAVEAVKTKWPKDNSGPVE